MSKISPDHYRQGSIETWDYIIDQGLDYVSGNIVKYVSRAGKKDNESRLDDFLKTQQYVDKAVTTEIHATLSGATQEQKSRIDVLLKARQHINKAIITELNNATSSTRSDAPSSAVQDHNEPACGCVHPCACRQAADFD